MKTHSICNETKNKQDLMDQLHILLMQSSRDNLFPPVLAHAQDLYHADEDVDKVQLKRDGLVDGVLGDQAGLSLACMVQHLLNVI